MDNRSSTNQKGYLYWPKKELPIKQKPIIASRKIRLKNDIFVIFDGTCAMCNRSVLFIKKRVRKQNFEYISNQSSETKSLLNSKQYKGDARNALILIENNKVFEKSTAALRICKRLKGLWPVLFVLIIVPPFIRDMVYDCIAKNRNRFVKRVPFVQIKINVKEVIFEKGKENKYVN